MNSKPTPIPTQSKNNYQTPFSWFYLIGIFGISLLSYDPTLLDYTLLPRYILASFIFLLTTIFLGIKTFSKNNNTQWPTIDGPTILLLCYFIWTLVSITWATNFSEAIFESQKGILAFSAFYMCRWFQLNDENFLPRLLKITIILSVGVLLFSGWQIFQLDTNIENAYYKIIGISGHKNLFSIVLFLLTGFLAIAYFKLENSWRKIIAVLLLISLLLIVYLRTRSVYLGISATVVTFLFLHFGQRLQSKRQSFLCKSIVGLIIITVFTFLYLLQNNQLIPLLQFSKLDELWQSDTGAERLVLWEKTAGVIRQSPIWGVGSGNWQIEYPNYSLYRLYSVELDFTTFQRPHNDWFWVWAETGIVGLIAYLGFFLGVLYKAWHHLKKEAAQPNQMANLCRYSFIVGYMVIANFTFPKERIEIILLLFTLMGLFYPTQISHNTKSKLMTKLILVTIILSTTLNLYIGQKRRIGENAMKKVLILKSQNKWTELIAATDRASSKWYTVDPTTVPVDWYRGTANFVLGKKEEALQNFLKAAKFTPYNQYVQNDLGTCYQRNGQREKARMHYKESARISPSFDDPRVNLAISYYNSGEYDQALGWLEYVRNKDTQTKYRNIILEKQQELNIRN